MVLDSTNPSGEDTPPLACGSKVSTQQGCLETPKVAGITDALDLAGPEVALSQPAPFPPEQIEGWMAIAASAMAGRSATASMLDVYAADHGSERLG